VGLEFGGVDFKILPRGLRMHKYRLEHEFGIVAFTTSQKLQLSLYIGSDQWGS
jgi:hypothetical protein